MANIQSVQKSVSNAVRKVALGRNNSPGRQSGAARASMVLCNASYYGTLAAVRSLGRAGVPVVTVDTDVLAPARYSRYSSLHLSSPSSQAADWSDWLFALGRSGPRRVIYA